MTDPQASYPERDVVLVGGGHTHALVVRAWGMAPPPDIRLTLINPGPFPPYSGMLPGFVAGHYRKEEVVMDLVPLAAFARARLILGAVTGIDLKDKTVMIAGRPPIAYDVLSLNVGINAEMPQIPGFAEHGVPVKPFAIFVAQWDRATRKMAGGTLEPDLAVIGGGVAGIELSLAMHHRLTALGLRPRITVIERGPDILSAANGRTRAIMRDAAQKSGISFATNAQVTGITDKAVTLRDGPPIASCFTVTAAGARPHDWIARTGLPLTDGFVTVDPDLRAAGHSHIFAVGDCAHMANDPRPKAGVFAVRQAPVLLNNLKALARGQRLKPYRPQKTFLKLVSIGGRDALAEKGGITLRHPLMWQWKDRIDRKFMDQFAQLPAMEPDTTPPLCAGCGAKIGGGILRDVLKSLPTPQNPDIISVPGDDAALIRRAGSHQVITTDHLRAFTDDAYLMGRIAATHALGDIWAMGAAPEGILVNLVLRRAHPRIHARMLTEAMAGISAVAADAGADILGGHTSEGAETCIGLTITGHAPAPIILSGARPGDHLILTKPLGTGTILAAAMTGDAQGDWMNAALTLMTRSLAPAAGILAPIAHAMTDVTGFGLAGHLTGMMTASGTAARLDPASVPLLAGAHILADKGIRSSLHAANAADAPITGLDPDAPEAALLHDPQTSGGLLAAIPAEKSAATLKALSDTGETAAIIGEVTQRNADIPVITAIYPNAPLNRDARHKP